MFRSNRRLIGSSRVIECSLLTSRSCRNLPRRASAHTDSRALQIGVLFAAFTLLISIPIWTHPLPPLSDYVNHLSRMQVIATLAKNPKLAEFYEINWQVIPEPDHGLHRADAGAGDEHLSGRPGLHGHDVRADHFGHAGAQSRAGRPLVGDAAVRDSASVQLRLPRRPDELHFRHRRRAVGAGRLGRGARTRLADPHRAVGGVRGRAVLLPSLGARHLRHRHSVVRNAAAVATARRAVAAAHRRLRRQRLAVPRRRAAARRQSDHGPRLRHLLGPARQDRRPDVYRRQLFRHHRLRADQRHGRGSGLGGASSRAALSSAGVRR